MKPKYLDWFYPTGLTVLIYSTLSIAPRIIIAFDRQILNGNLSYFLTLFFVAVGLALLFLNLFRFGINDLARHLWLLVIFGAAFAVIKIPGTPAERIHFLEYAILSLLWWRVLQHYSISNRQAYVSVFLITASLGSLDELIQFFLPNRYFGYDDIIRNVSGGILGITYLGLVEKKKADG